MLILDRMLVGGLRFVLDKLVQAVDGELNDESALRDELLRLQMEHDLGKISGEELARGEAEILDRLREILARKGGGGPISMGGGTGEEELKVASVEATFGGDEAPPPEEPPGPPVSKGRTRRAR